MYHPRTRLSVTAQYAARPGQAIRPEPDRPSTQIRTACAWAAPCHAILPESVHPSAQTHKARCPCSPDRPETNPPYARARTALCAAAPFVPSTPNCIVRMAKLTRNGARGLPLAPGPHRLSARARTTWCLGSPGPTLHHELNRLSRHSERVVPLGPSTPNRTICPLEPGCLMHEQTLAMPSAMNRSICQPEPTRHHSRAVQIAPNRTIHKP